MTDELSEDISKLLKKFIYHEHSAYYGVAYNIVNKYRNELCYKITWKEIEEQMEAELAHSNNSHKHAYIPKSIMMKVCYWSLKFLYKSHCLIHFKSI